MFDKTAVSTQVRGEYVGSIAANKEENLSLCQIDWRLFSRTERGGEYALMNCLKGDFAMAPSRHLAIIDDTTELIQIWRAE